MKKGNKVIKHLVDGCDIAIKNWPTFITNCDLVVTMDWNKSYTDNILKAKAHYENGGTIETRP